MIPGNIFHPLRSPQRITSPVPGGVCRIEFVPVDWVLFLPDVDPKYGTASAKVRLIQDQEWLHLRTPDRDRGIEERQVATDAGPHVETFVTGYLPFDSVTNSVLLNAMRYFRYILIVTLSNGIRKLVGTIDNPVSFSRDFTSGPDGTADMGSVLQFRWISESGPTIYLAKPSDNLVVDPLIALALGVGTGAALGDASGHLIGKE